MGLILVALFVTILVLGVLALVKVIWGREAVNLTLGGAKATLGCGFGIAAWAFVALLTLFLPWIAVTTGHRAAAPWFRLVGCFLAMALLIPSAVSGLRTARDERRKGKDDEAYWTPRNAELRRQSLLAHDAVERLKAALVKADDMACVAACKELRENQFWDLGLPPLKEALADPHLNTRLCAIHGFRYVHDEQRVQRAAYGLKDERGYPTEPYNGGKEWWPLVELFRERAEDASEDKRIRVAVLLMAGNSRYKGFDGTVNMLLQDRDNDVRAAAYRASRQTMTSENAHDFYCNSFDDLLTSLNSRHERLTQEAVLTAVCLASHNVMTDADFTGIVMTLQNMASDPGRSTAVHDEANTAVVALKNIQRSQWAERQQRRS